MKLNIHKFVSGMAFFMIAVSPCGSGAQNAGNLPGKLVVGTLDIPLYAMKAENGRWEGLGIALLRAVAGDLDIEFELHEYDNIKQIADALEKRELDLVPVVPISREREFILDFTDPYHRSGLAIAVRSAKDGQGWLHVIHRLVSMHFLSVIGVLFLMWLTAGALVWSFESRRHHEMFGKGTLKGLGNGIWWAAVTMTTVGYGDKSPRTPGGRIVAVIWMLTSIILLSTFTATITASLTVAQFSGMVRGPRDLPSVRVGSVARSAALSYLTDKGIASSPYKNVRVGLQAVVEARIDAFVFDEAILKYLIRTQFPIRLQVLPETFDHYYVSMAVPPGSHLREPLNRGILKFMASNEWPNLLKKYLGAGT